MIVGERPALIGVQLARQSPAPKGFLQALMKTACVRPPIVSGVGHDTGMVVNESAQMGRLRFLLPGDTQEGSRGKVRHPQFIDPGRFKGFGRAAQGLTNQIMARTLIQGVTLEGPILLPVTTILSCTLTTHSSRICLPIKRRACRKPAVSQTPNC